jgi:hypothetical protein
MTARIAATKSKLLSFPIRKSYHKKSEAGPSFSLDYPEHGRWPDKAQKSQKNKEGEKGKQLANRVKYFTNINC